MLGKTITSTFHDEADAESPSDISVDCIAEPRNGANGENHLDEIGLCAEKVHRFVARRVANAADAEEIAQQSLFLACKKIDTIHGESLERWLYGTARHLIVDHYRSQTRFKFLEVSEVAESETEPALHTRAETVHSVCDCRERVRSWVDCIRHSLQLEQQVAVLLADVHGYSDKDSAILMGVSLQSFKLLLHESRTRLHETAGGTCTLVKRSEVDGLPSRLPALRPTAGCGGCANGAGHCTSGYTGVAAESAGAPGRCCVGSTSCRSRKCCFAIKCRLGVKCCRKVPELTVLRDRLLGVLTLS